MKWKSFVMMLAVGGSLLLASCGGTAAVTTYTIAGTVYGLAGTGLVLQDNATDNLTIVESGNFIFATALVSGASYAVTVLTQPSNPAQTCVVTNGSGTVIADVSAVQVTCNTNSFTVGVTVSGLSGTGLVLQNNGTNNLPVTSNGTYTFSNPLPRGSTYNVTVLTQPSSPAQTCGVTNGYGTLTIANATGILVNCVTTTTTYTIGVTVSGLAGTGLILQDNGGDNLPASANGNYTFATPIASGTTYSVAVLTQPSSPSQNCVVTIGTGTATANVMGIPVACSTNMANVGVIVSGLLPQTNVVLQDNGSDNLTVHANGAVTNFNTPMAKNSSYAVTVLQQPAGGACIVGSGGHGTITGGNVGVEVTCGSILAVGKSHTCALTSAGTVSCWGSNANGQLGNGTLVDSSVPAQVLNAAGNAPLSGVIAIAAGQDHTCAVTSGGAALCWGDNSEGELGVASSSAKSSLPVAVPGLSNGVAGISAGAGFTCAVTSAGAAECWGEGGSGQLGNGAATSSAAPVQVSGLTSGVDAIAAGDSHACALTNTGAVWCWGLNAYGQLGDGTLLQSSVPVRVLASTGSGPLSGIVAISAGQNYSCAVAAAGASQCWGEGGASTLAGASVASSAVAVQISAPSSSVIAVAAGASHACSVNSAGAVWCWGLNANGQLGDGNTVSSTVPVEVVGAGGAGFLELF